MTTATAQDRLRQIAILVSSVDTVAARQILLHLPSDAARQVRAMASQMGSVAPEERRRILAEFQRSAASASESPKSRLQVPQAKALPVESEFMSVLSPVRHVESPATGNRIEGEDRSNAAAWTRLSTAALVRFVRGERPAISAVVISQLAPRVAVEVLQHLPAEVSRDILLRLSRLQEIAPEAMVEIDEHLSQRLHEYQHRLESELENTRRIDALLNAAPESLRRQWARDLHGANDVGQPSTSVPEELVSAAESRMAYPTPEPDVLDLGEATQVDVAAASVNEEGDQLDNNPTILPFAPLATTQYTQVDRSLIELEFEQILLLPPPTLAMLLSSTDSQTVLLGLAGATPEFMRRFYRMLDRGDAKTLRNRLQRIGAIHLRDVDEAQRRIVENAARIAGVQQDLPVRRPLRQQAA